MLVDHWLGIVIISLVTLTAANRCWKRWSLPHFPLRSFSQLLCIHTTCKSATQFSERRCGWQMVVKNVPKVFSQSCETRNWDSLHMQAGTHAYTRTCVVSDSLPHISPPSLSARKALRLNHEKSWCLHNSGWTDIRLHWWFLPSWLKTPEHNETPACQWEWEIFLLLFTLCIKRCWECQNLQYLSRRSLRWEVGASCVPAGLGLSLRLPL